MVRKRWRFSCFVASGVVAVVRPGFAVEKPRKVVPYSGSVESLNRTVSLMLP
jgi:hypothetical protein